jgi:serine/threonine protein kinase HipA of HipAB toxin-antitoxin module
MKKKKTKEKPNIPTDDKVMEENMFANVAAISALTEIISTYGDRLRGLESDMDKVANKLKQVLSRMGL